VSVSTIGISAHIDINGNVLTRTEENLAAQLSGNVRANNSQTIANSLGGYAPVLVIFLFMLFPIVLRIVRSR
jgi:apolipoprotein N-acyltransferase